MSVKPEALRLAQEFEIHAAFGSGMTIRRTEVEAAAAQLRNLHAENERLRELLIEARSRLGFGGRATLNLAERIDAALNQDSQRVE